MATNNLSLLRNFLNTLPNNSIYSLAINGIGKSDINASNLFNNYQNLNKITSLNITYNITHMNYMFSNCYNLTTIPNFNTSNVISMSNMFDCTIY